MFILIVITSKILSRRTLLQLVLPAVEHTFQYDVVQIVD